MEGTEITEITRIKGKERGKTIYEADREMGST